VGNFVVFDILEQRMAAARGWKYPPAGVPVEPVPGRKYVSLNKAAQRLGIDRRTLLGALMRGDTAGWARPGPGNLRWFVYEDALTRTASDDTAGMLNRLEAENQTLRSQLADLQHPGLTAGGSDSTDTVIADLRARAVRAEEANLLLIAAHEDLAAAAEKYRQALGLFMTPGHVGELT
jgi:hypothetical protein